jgi:hypothetical protein
MLCTLGVWVVKVGRESDFVRRWEESAGNLSLEFADVTSGDLSTLDLAVEVS